MQRAKRIHLNGEKISREEAKERYGKRRFFLMEREAYEDHLMEPRFPFPFYGEDGILVFYFD